MSNDEKTSFLAEKHSLILVTGATGRIGSVVVADLLERGYQVRATTSKPHGPDVSANMEWRVVDFAADIDADTLVHRCDAVIHLAADLGQIGRMQRVNVDATRALAQAAERNGVKAFCYTSSVSVYGSGLSRVITEDSPVLTTDRDVRSEYWALEYVRMYGRTKLAGEHALQQANKTVAYTIFRPTVVVNIDAIIGIKDWSPAKRNFAAHRHAHHVYVWDVSDALIWAMERALKGRSAPGSIETYNLSEDDFPEPTNADFLRKARAVSTDPLFRVLPVPGLFDWAHDAIRFHTLPLRRPLWMMRFPADRLQAAGWRPRFGLGYAYAQALDQIRTNSAGRSLA